MDCSCVNKLPPIYKGDDATIKVMVEHPDGSYMNFNGKTIKFIVKKEKTETDTEAVISKTLEPVTDIHELDIVLSSTETNITPNMYWFGIRIIDNNYQTTEAEGKLEIKQGPFYAD